jgi:molecular chaperone GrpE
MSKSESKQNSTSAGPGEMWDSEASQSLPADAVPPADASGEESPAAAGDSPQRLDDYQHKLDEAEGRVLRAQAELENFRRRARREAEDQLKYSSMPLMSDLVEVVDNLDRAIAAADNSSAPGIVDGIKMVQAQLEMVLEKHGCRRINARPDTEFDPHLHSALNMQPSNDIAANHILQESRSGFQLHDRVVRPAQVIVSTGPQPS